MVSPRPSAPQGESLALPFPDCGKLKNGAHMEAFFSLLDITEDVMRNVRQRTGKLRVLDFGTGKYGAGRAILEPRMEKGEELALYDPSTRISSPIHPETTHIVGDKEALEYTDGRFNVVNISYVLCLIEPEEARRILNDLSFAHPNAQFLITDYVLRGREELLPLLDSNEEVKWRERIGADAFNRTHARFDPASLRKLILDGGLSDPNGSSWYLDHAGIRETLLTEPEPQYCY